MSVLLRIAVALACAFGLSAQNARTYMAYDEARQVVVALAGFNTWEWNGQSWTQASAVLGWSQPPVVVYDPIGRRVLALDPEGPNSSGGWIYAYTGSSWTVVSSGGTGPVTWGAAAFDRSRGRLVAQLWDRTWEWDGANWILRATTTSPGRIDGSVMAFDPLRGRCVLAGGAHSRFVYEPNTYEWDGNAWTMRPSAVARSDHAMVYDAARGRVVMCGGTWEYPNYFTILNDMKEWDGTNWTARGGVPMNLLFPGLACDLAHGQLVYRAQSTMAQYPHAQAATWATFGSNCTGPGLNPRLGLGQLAMAWLGSNALLDLGGLGNASFGLFALGLSNTQWGSTPLPLGLAGFGLPGCTALVSPDTMMVAPAASGLARLPLPVPNVASLVGSSVFVQGIAAAPGVNAAGLLVSDGAHLTVGLQ